MAIRLTSGCINCENLTKDSFCKIYEIKVEAKHTCDSFNMVPSLEKSMDCTSCGKFLTSKCPNKAHAAADMLCNEWVPNVQA